MFLLKNKEKNNDDDDGADIISDPISIFSHALYLQLRIVLLFL